MSEQLTVQPSVSPSFRRVPMNPYTEKVNQALQQDNAAPAPASQPVVPPVTVTQPAPAPASQPVTQPTPAPTPTQVLDPRVISAYQQSEAERLRLAQELETQRETINNLLKSQQELDQLKQRQALQDSLNQDAFADLGTVDPEDAKKISNAVLNATAPVMTAIQQENARLRQQIAESQEQIAARLEQQRIQQLNQRLLAAHPDFIQLQNDPAYIAFMNQRDGLSHMTRDQRAAQEFSAGNVDYVIDMLNQLKGVQPSADSITSVAPVQTAAAAQVSQQVATPPMDLRTLNSLYQMRQISHDEYREKLKELRAAQ